MMMAFGNSDIFEIVELYSFQYSCQGYTVSDVKLSKDSTLQILFWVWWAYSTYCDYNQWKTTP